MPSSFGHALAGVAAAWSADLVPGNRAWRTAAPTASWYRRAGDGVTLLCAMLATIPDLDLLFRFHRRFTHSLGAVVCVGIVAAAAALRLRLPAIRVAFMCAAAYATHLVLDWLAVDALPPYGIQAFWPFSDAWVISGWNLFQQTERRHFLSAATMWTNLQAMAQEMAILAPVVLVLWLVRVKALARLSAQMSRGDHSTE